jgi:hypothetical protein
VRPYERFESSVQSFETGKFEFSEKDAIAECRNGKMGLNLCQSVDANITHINLNLCALGCNPCPLGASILLSRSFEAGR